MAIATDTWPFSPKENELEQESYQTKNNCISNHSAMLSGIFFFKYLTTAWYLVDYVS